MTEPTLPTADFDQSLAARFHRVLTEAPETHTYRFVTDSGLEHLQSLSNGALDRRAAAVAATLQQQCAAGSRVLIVCQPGFDYITAFLGCLYAGMVAVPVYPPDHITAMRTLPRAQSIVADCAAEVALAPADMRALFEEHRAALPGLAALTWIAIDEIDESAAQRWRRPEEVCDVAFIQYTSGSTGDPKGVMLGNDNLQANIDAICARFIGDDPNAAGVIWLPPYHDMGLIGGLLVPPLGRIPVTLMSPMTFLKRPGRWLRTISETRATISGAPDFAYALAAAKMRPSEREGLDLSSWRLAFSGAEPVRPQTLRAFAESFAPYGFSAESFYPCYGMAETTLLVSGSSTRREPVVRTLAAGDQSREVVGCGEVVDDHRVVIVDPDTRAALPAEAIGEIWVQGPSVGRGYWGRPELSSEVFDAHLDTGEGPFLRTGDLGFRSGDELFVTGRIKDLIVIAGKNHYPQDIESTVQATDPALRENCGVASSYDHAGQERLMIAQEVVAPKDRDLDALLAQIRDAVAREHGLVPHDIVLLRTGSVPKTSSGKLQRRALTAAFLDGSLAPLAAWTSPVLAAARR